MSVPVAAPLSPEQIARRSGSSFLVSFGFLQPRRRRGLTAVYAFCRVVDDAVDDARDAEQAREHLEFWRKELEAAYGGTPATELGRSLRQVREEFGVRAEYLREVLEGVAMDLDPPAYQDLGDLERYCYKVASAVGLACLSVFGVSGEDAETYADRLGKALQLTNILRDLKGDAKGGHVYVPQDWLRQTGVEPEWLEGEGPDDAYASGGPVDRLVRLFVAAARTRYSEAEAALMRLSRRDRRRLLPARIMGAVYRDLLGALERRGGDLRLPPVRVRKRRKLFLALKTALGAGS